MIATQRIPSTHSLAILRDGGRGIHSESRGDWTVAEPGSRRVRPGRLGSRARANLAGTFRPAAVCSAGLPRPAGGPLDGPSGNSIDFKAVGFRRQESGRHALEGLDD